MGSPSTQADFADAVVKIAGAVENDSTLGVARAQLHETYIVAQTADGIVIFNDYVLWDPFMNTEYGVVQAVNQFLAEGGWTIVGFAFQPHMFCDIARLTYQLIQPLCVDAARPTGVGVDAVIRTGCDSVQRHTKPYRLAVGAGAQHQM